MNKTPRLLLTPANEQGGKTRRSSTLLKSKGGADVMLMRLVSGDDGGDGDVRQMGLVGERRLGFFFAARVRVNYVK
ncbi:hypothetical protein GQ457_04G014140 [Hibiscus cannabinus]